MRSKIIVIDLMRVANEIRWYLETVGKPTRDDCEWLQLVLEDKKPAGYGFYSFSQMEHSPDVWVTKWTCSEKRYLT